MPPPDLIQLDAAAIAAAVNAGRLDPVDVTDAFLAQIARRNPAVNAIVDHDEAAPRAEAAALRARIAAGETLPLAGVPVVVKDSIWVAGRRITQGCPLFQDFRPERDALPVARMRAAGAIVLGIGNMPELGAKEVTDNRLYGETSNPLDPARTPGGSSGGCAAALAADMAPLALGGDGGGSCRRPPAHVGMAGFKPSSGAVADPWGFPSTLPGIATTAPMGRSVADVRALFAAIAGPHPLDPLSAALPPHSPRLADTLRIAYSPRLGLDLAVDDDVLAGLEAAVAVLSRAGLSITRADPAWAPGTCEDDILAIEDSGLAAQFGPLWAQDPALFDPYIAWQIERGMQRSAVEVAVAVQASLGMAVTMAAFFGEWDLLLCPTTACVAWPLGQLNPDTIGGQPARHRGHAAFTPLFNHARTPALTLPCGTGQAGLPIGLQVIGPRGSDHLLLETASVIEQALRSLV
jgi:aspartyl-tRNA(Asn)/glutamyl-tRNA(Gln) amidotransferase subunit A